jgi:hypothetical protein
MAKAIHMMVRVLDAEKSIDFYSSIAKADFGDQLLEAVTLDAARARFAEILVDDMHTLMGPSQTNGAIDQAVLQLSTLLMLPNLVQG